MEKYSGFCDPITGTNPYYREIKWAFFPTRIFIPDYVPFLIYAVIRLIWCCIFNGDAATVLNPESIRQKTEEGVDAEERVYSCTYTTLLDPFVLHQIFPSVNIYLVLPDGVYRMNRFSVRTKVEREEIEKKKRQKETVVLFLTGGVTNHSILLDVSREAKSFGVRKYISIRYTPDMAYDVNVFNRVVIPYFHTNFEGFSYILFYYTSFWKKPVADIKVASSLTGLSEATSTEIAIGMNMYTTDRFVKLFV